MIAGLRGEIVSTSDDAILVDVHGVIYQVAHEHKHACRSRRCR